MDERLDMRIRSSAVETAHRVAPWRPDIAWWIVGIQGVVALVVGVWLLLNQGAGEPVLSVLALAFLVLACLWTWSAMRSDLPQVVLGWRGLRGGVGIATGTLVVLDVVADFLTPAGSLVVLTVGLLLVGVAGAAEWWVGRERMGWRWPSLVGPLVAIGFGAAVLVSRLQATPLFLQVIAIGAVAVGVLLILRAGLLLRQEQQLRSAPSTPGASSAPTPIPQASAGAAAPTITVRSAGSSKPGDPPPPASPGA